MATDLVPIDPLDGVEKRWRMAQRIADTEFVPQAFRRRPEAVLAAIQYGAEIGIGPMQSLQSIDVIQGKPTLSAEAMRARVFTAGHTIITERYDNEVCTLTGKRSDGTAATVTFTMEDAARMGLAGKDNWRKFPRNMLLARCTSELCRLLFPDVLSSISYMAEELGGEPEVENPSENPQHIEDADVLDAEEVDPSLSTVPGPETGEGSPIDGVLPAVELAESQPADDEPPLTDLELPITPTLTDTAVSKMRVHDLLARVAALQARKVSVAGPRKAAGLSLLKEGISVSEYAEWEALVTGLEKDNP